MKKIFLPFILIISLVIVSCGSTPAQTQSGLPEIVRNARRNAPQGVLIGIGSAKLATQSQSRTVAETRARAEIARAMNTIVEEMVLDYTASSEVDRSAAMSFQQNVTRTLTEARLQGAVIVDEDFIDGTYYVVIHLSKADVVNEINQAQAAAKLAVPAMAAFNAEARMDAAFGKAASAEPKVADR